MSSATRDWTYVAHNCIVFLGFLMFSWFTYHAERNYRANSDNIAANNAAIVSNSARIKEELESHRRELGETSKVLTKDQMDVRRSLAELKSDNEEVIRYLKNIEVALKK